MKKKLLIIAGAGASAEFGMPMGEQIDREFLEISRQLFRDCFGADVDLYSVVSDILSTRYSAATGYGAPSVPNFEDKLYGLYLLLSTCEDVRYRTPLGSLFDFPQEVSTKLTSSASVREQVFRTVQHLQEHLYGQFRFRCQELQKTHAGQFSLLKSFLERLRGEREIGLVTLNYDNIIEQALPGLETGFAGNGDTFNPYRIWRMKNWNFAFHLHGSVNFDLSKHWGNIEWRDLSESTNYPASMEYRPPSKEGLELISTPLIAGYGKLDALQLDPFRTYYQELDRVVYESDAILICGYGFGDRHVNEAFRYLQYDNTKSHRPVLILTYGADGCLLMRERDDPESVHCRTCLHFGWDPYDLVESSGWSVAEIKRKKGFERLRLPWARTPVSIWYGGFLEACRNPDAILRELG